MKMTQDNFWNDERLKTYIDTRTDGGNGKPSEYAQAIERALKRSIFALADLQMELIRREGVKGDMQYCKLGDSGSANADFQWDSYDFSGYTSEELKKLQDTWTVELYPGEEVSIADSDHINTELKSSGSKLRLISGMFSGYREVLLGHCKKITGEDNTHYLEVMKEHAKTPGIADNVASLANPGLYVVLLAGCTRVAKIKYQPSLDAALSNVSDRKFPKTLSALQERLDLALLRSYINRLGKDETRLATAVTTDVALQSRLYCRGQLNQHRLLGLDNIALINALGTHLKSLEFGTDTPRLVDFKGMAAFTEFGADNTGGNIFEIHTLARKDLVRARECLLMFLSDAIYMDAGGQYEQKSLMVLAAFLPCVCGGELRLDALDRAVRWWKDYINNQFIDFLSEIQALVLAARHFNPPNSDHEIAAGVIETQLVKFLSDSATERMTPMEKKKNFAWINAMWNNRLLLMSRFALEDYSALATRVFEFVSATHTSLVSGIHPEWTGRKTDLRGIVETLCQEAI